MRSLHASMACRSSSEVVTPMKDYGKMQNKIKDQSKISMHHFSSVHQRVAYANPQKIVTVNYNTVWILRYMCIQINQYHVNTPTMTKIKAS